MNVQYFCHPSCFHIKPYWAPSMSQLFPLQKSERWSNAVPQYHCHLSSFRIKWTVLFLKAKIENHRLCYPYFDFFLFINSFCYVLSLWLCLSSSLMFLEPFPTTILLSLYHILKYFEISISVIQRFTKDSCHCILFSCELSTVSCSMILWRGTNSLVFFLFQVVLTQVNGVNNPSESIHSLHVGKMRIKLCKGKNTIAKEYYSSSMQVIRLLFKIWN